MIILAKTSQLFSADSLVGKSSYGSIALPPDEGLEGRPFAFAQGDKPHKCRGDILPTVSLRVLHSGKDPRKDDEAISAMSHELSAMSHDRVILSAAKNLDCYADLCNPGTGEVQTVSDRQCSLQLYIGLRANPGFISLKRRAVRVRLHLPEQFNGSFKELICQFIQGVKLFL